MEVSHNLLKMLFKNHYKGNIMSDFSVKMEIISGPNTMQMNTFSLGKNLQ